ncbi:hypothetical protein MMYC01_204086 [Madurella mycetomatis]|uniref:Cytochrome b561 domain-containing protein n=1 Tax=Madurella mycetomatis TaxID=100816 RepID=A0A175WCB2_9PEZI|nr:hypothetical protein MMYC01_204808 [Madurella mycetomatis]KXX81129.1 hypothetical protein MMYC01_204086 [Madurella mycetomatis]
MDASRKLVAILASASTVHAQQVGGYGGPFGGAPGSNNSQGGADFEVSSAERVRAIHGILGALAMVVLFPGGSLLIRVLPGRLALWAHALAQLVSICVFIAAVALGIHLVRQVGMPFGDGSIMSNRSINYHPIIGLVVLVCLLFQPVLGIIHHVRFKKLGRRQFWSYLHLFNGRGVITLGIINGGLGLWMAQAPTTLKTAYIAVAAAMWSLWMLAALWDEVRRWRVSRKEMHRKLAEGETSY